MSEFNINFATDIEIHEISRNFRPGINRQGMPIPKIEYFLIQSGQHAFILGPNGSGKSRLLHQIFVQNHVNARKIPAHRMLTFTSNSMSLSNQEAENLRQSTRNADIQETHVSQDFNIMQRSRLELSEVFTQDNKRSQQIAHAVDSNDFDLAKQISNNPSKIDVINLVLKSANIQARIAIQGDNILAYRKENEYYPLPELSDGERNAVIIAASVLTAPNESLILIDEPERHLHRSITTPLLRTLFSMRHDCAFLIATHELTLPEEIEDSILVLVRGVSGFANSPVGKYWDVDIINSFENFPDDVITEIIGSKRKIIFVEGETKSHDRIIYGSIFDDATIIPRGSCAQVEKSTIGLNSNTSIHAWVKAYGIIDNDGRTDEQIEKLKGQKIVALNVNSIESILYHPRILSKLNRGQNAINDVLLSAINNIETAKRRLVAIRCEREIRKYIEKSFPTLNDIIENPAFEVRHDFSPVLQKYTQQIDIIIKNKDFECFLKHFPMKHSGARSNISKSLGYRNINAYEIEACKLISSDIELKTWLRAEVFTELVEIIDVDE